MSRFWSSAMNVFSELRQNWDNGMWWRERVRDRINSPVQTTVRPQKEGVNFVERDWDTLVLLDACRNDLFQEVVDKSKFDNLTTVISPGSFTREWLSETFDGEHGDIVYVTGNPMVSDQKSDSFHSLIEAWREGWDPEKKIVRPNAVTDAAIQARENYPKKRIIVHYMQPHAPFIDHPELNFWAEPEKLGLERSPQRSNVENHIDDVWDALAFGLVEKDDVWEGYRYTLEQVLDEVDILLDNFDDRIVVTSDHGNLLGERGWPIPVRVYGHPANQRMSDLIQVPWAIVEGDRRKIESGSPESESEASEREVWDQLSKLGYVDN